MQAFRPTAIRLYKSPRNLHVAPQYDTWSEKHEAWVHLRKMSKLAATGFYIPPAWYQHFRMFPPTQSFTQEKTLNPQNSPDETQIQGDKLHPDDAARTALRDELGRHARSAAAAGNRYLNQFWVRKPIDEMERQYNELTKKKRFTHDEALRQVLQTYRAKQASKARAHIIQAEEAKLSGKFISMREALAIMGVINTVQVRKLAPQDYANMTEDVARQYLEDPMMTSATVTKKVKKPTPAPDAAAAPSDAAATQPMTEATGDDDDSILVEEIVTTPTPGDSLPKMREVARDGLSAEDEAAGAMWYGGFSPEVEINAPGFKP